MRKEWTCHLPTLAVLLLAGGIQSLSAQSVTTVGFQNGIDGYDGTFDRRISSDPGNESNGAETAAYFLDGSNNGNSPDTQGLLRFDDIFGNDDGQVPMGATILDARLTINTSVAGNAQTGGPYGVAGVLEEVSEDTFYEDFIPNDDVDVDIISRGAWWQDGSATRPVAAFGFQLPGTQDTARVTPIVQAWSSDAIDNLGFVIQAGRSDTTTDQANTSDGWSYRTTGYPFAVSRPKLEIDYTTEEVVVSSFQEGVDGYEGTGMAFVRSGTNAFVEDTDDPLNAERTEDGFDLGQSFLDGVFYADLEGNTNSPDDFALLHFDGVFGGDDGQAPADVPVAKAWAVITTGDTDNNARTSGEWSVHSMLREWDTESLHSSFGDDNGLQVLDGDISEELDSQSGFIRGAEVWFDVTEYAEGVRNGADDFGLAVLTKRTADGWLIHATGSEDEAARPRLVVYSADLGVSEQLAADCDGSGALDFADLSCVHLTSDPIGARDQVLEAIPTLAGDLNGDGNVNVGDFLILSRNFNLTNDEAPAYTDGNIDMQDGVNVSDFLALSRNFNKLPAAGAASAVPEPAGWQLALLPALMMLVRRRRR